MPYERSPRARRAAAAAVLLATLGAGLAACGGRAPGFNRTGPPPSSRPATTTSPAPPPYGPVPAAGKTFVGIQTAEGPYDMRTYTSAAGAAGKAPAVLMFSQSWARDDFDAELLDRIAARGAMPMIAWEPWDPSAPSDEARLHGVQPNFALARIIDGSFDPYLRRWANGLRNWGHPVAIRFAHEMNGNWYPWDEQVNGNRPGEYLAAWRHVHDVFTTARARNVIWVWSPNIAYQGCQPLAAIYPGDGYADWVGVVGYYGREESTPPGYPSFDQLYGPTLAELRRLTRRPVVITEAAGIEAGGHKAAWITGFFAGLRRHPEIRGFIWFQVNKETDWRFTSSPAALKAFAIGVASPRYQAAAQPR